MCRLRRTFAKLIPTFCLTIFCLDRSPLFFSLFHSDSWKSKKYGDDHMYVPAVLQQGSSLTGCARSRATHQEQITWWFNLAIVHTAFSTFLLTSTSSITQLTKLSQPRPTYVCVVHFTLLQLNKFTLIFWASLARPCTVLRNSLSHGMHVIA
jgi:hypothetical protein